MIFVKKIEIVFEKHSLKMKFGNKIFFENLSEINLSKDELTMYRKFVDEYCTENYGKKFDDPEKPRESNYEVFFTFFEKDI